MKWLLVLWFAGTAWADPEAIYPDYAGPVPDYHLRCDGGLALHVGSLEAGNTGDIDDGIGPEVSCGVDIVRLVAHASISELEVPNDKNAPTDGVDLNLGADLRVSLIRAKVVATGKHGYHPHFVREDLWVGLGGGREMIDWYRGPDTDRNYLAVSLGASDFIRFGPENGGHARMSIWLELDTAKPPPERSLPDRSPHDHSFTFNFSVAVGN